MKKLMSIIVILVLACGAFSACSDKDYNYEIDENSNFGLYFYGDKLDETVRVSDSMDTKYFDPSKPTVVYTHGWKTNRNDPAETMSTHPATTSNTGVSVNYLRQYKKAGYNVGIFDWYEYSLGSLNSLDDKIWNTIDNGYSLSFCFASELAIACGGSYDKEITLLGHSFGSQMATATAYVYNKMQDNGKANANAKITKVGLADPYWQSGEAETYTVDYVEEKMNGRSTVEMVGDVFEFLSQRDTAIIVYPGMNIASYCYTALPNLEAVNKKLSDNSVYVNLGGLRTNSGAISNIHTVARDYMMISFYTPLTLDDTQAAAPSICLSSAELRAFNGKFFTQAITSLNATLDGDKIYTSSASNIDELLGLE